MLQILHNPRCTKSRNCLAFLNESKVPYEIIDYLNEPLNAEEIRTLLSSLNMKPLELIRQKESIWIEKYKGKQLTDDEIIAAMEKYPILIERPILIGDGKAIIGRDVEKLEQFFANNSM